MIWILLLQFGVFRFQSWHLLTKTQSLATKKTCGTTSLPSSDLATILAAPTWGFPKNSGPEYSTLRSRILNPYFKDLK